MDGLVRLNINLDDPSTIEDNTIQLDKLNTRTIDRTGGTFLHTHRTNPQNVRDIDLPDFLEAKEFKKNDQGNLDCTPHVLKVLDHLNIDVLIPIGGDDTLGYGARLHEENFPIVSIPKTMDNDVYGTDYCLGFSTSITRSVGFWCTNCEPQPCSHERIAIVELFGRNSGSTALVTGYLAYADRTIIPEVPFNVHHLSDLLKADRKHNPSNYAMCVISEGAFMEDGDIHEKGEEDAFGHKKLGGIGQYTAQKSQRTLRCQHHLPTACLSNALWYA